MPNTPKYWTLAKCENTAPYPPRSLTALTATTSSAVRAHVSYPVNTADTSAIALGIYRQLNNGLLRFSGQQNQR